MEQIILEKDYLEYFKWKRNRRNIIDIPNEQLMDEIDETLDVLKKIEEMMEKLNGNSVEINIEEYNNFLDLLTEERYEEMNKYKII